MGGEASRAASTHWSLIEEARANDPPRSLVAIGELARLYWKPVYCYLRRTGRDNEKAKDLTQGFFEKLLTDRAIVEQADPAVGRFRTFLLTAVTNYARSAERAAKRSPRQPILSLDGLHCPEVLGRVSSASPEKAFTYAWASEMLNRALTQTEMECRRTGKATHWEVFRERVVLPILDGAEAPPLADVCARLGIEDQAKASNMIVTVKRRFQAALRGLVLEVVGSEAEVEDEIREMMAAVAG